MYGTTPQYKPVSEQEYWRPSPQDQIKPNQQNVEANVVLDREQSKVNKFFYPFLGILAVVYTIISIAILGFTGRAVMVMFTWVSFVIFFGISVAACTCKYYSDRDIEGGILQKAVDMNSSAFWGRVLASLSVVYVYLFLFVALDGGFTEKHKGFVAFTICFSASIFSIGSLVKWFHAKKERNELMGVV